MNEEGDGFEVLVTTANNVMNFYLKGPNPDYQPFFKSIEEKVDTAFWLISKMRDAHGEDVTLEDLKEEDGLQYVRIKKYWKFLEHAVST